MRKMRWSLGGRTAGGEHQAFLDATLPHLDTVYRIARHLADDSWDADDLVQETYLRAFAKFGQHRGENTRAWLAVICLNTARSEARRRRRRPGELLAADPGPETIASDDVAAQALASLDRRDIAHALSQLPEEQRICILLMDVAGYTASEVASIRGCGRGTVLSRVHRGRRRLAGLLAGVRINEEVNREPS
jgi:RNA polymerase sigma-70 factor (ECF subfamily)